MFKKHVIIKDGDILQHLQVVFTQIQIVLKATRLNLSNISLYTDSITGMNNWIKVDLVINFINYKSNTESL